MRTVRRSPAVAAVALLLLGCAEPGDLGPRLPAYRLVISPDSALVTGLFFQDEVFSVRLLRASGDEVPTDDSTITFEILQDSVGELIRNGALWSLGPERYTDRAIVRAQLGEFVDSAVLVISAGPKSAVSSVFVMPDSLYLAVGDTHPYYAGVVRSLTHSFLEPLDSARILHPSLARADSAYRVFGLAPGVTELRAHRGTRVGTALLTVVGPQPPLESVRMMAAAHNESCAIPSTGGDVTCWPIAYTGQLPGVGATVPGTAGFESIGVGGGAFCGVLANGEAYCWGYNRNGQLGTGDTDDRTTPTLVTGGHLFRSVYPGNEYTCGIKADSTAVCWGESFYGIGDGTTQQRLEPTPVAGDFRYLSLSRGGSYTCGVRADSTAVCWGYGGGQGLGNNSTSASPVPVVVLGGHKTVQIAAGFHHACLLNAAGAMWCWGTAVSGTLGDGATTLSGTPVPVVMPQPFVSIGAGAGYTCGLSTAGAAWCWGWPIDGGTIEYQYPVRNTPTLVPGGHVFASLAVGVRHACGVKANGETWCWGANSNGLLGDGTTLGREKPVRVRAP